MQTQIQIIDCRVKPKQVDGNVPGRRFWLQSHLQMESRHGRAEIGRQLLEYVYWDLGFAKAGGKRLTLRHVGL